MLDGSTAAFRSRSKAKTHKKSTASRLNLNENISSRSLTDRRKAAVENSAASRTSLNIRKNGSSVSALNLTLNESNTSSPTTGSGDNASDVGDDDWLDESNLLAQYNDSDSATEEERAAALLDELQVSFQENSTQLKRDLGNSLLKTLNDIRQTHLSIDRGPDVDRGKGIAIFNSACDERHTNAQRLQAEFQDDLAENQAEMKQIFGQLKQCYITRKQMWKDFETKIVAITNRQMEIVERCERETAEAMSNFDEKYGPRMKEESLKSKEKLLRDVLEKI